jgi:hypothetical protein
MTHLLVIVSCVVVAVAAAAAVAVVAAVVALTGEVSAPPCVAPPHPAPLLPQPSPRRRLSTQLAAPRLQSCSRCTTRTSTPTCTAASGTGICGTCFSPLVRVPPARTSLHAALSGVRPGSGCRVTSSVWTPCGSWGCGAKRAARSKIPHGCVQNLCMVLDTNSGHWVLIPV